MTSTIVIDLDATLTLPESDGPYEYRQPNSDVLKALKRYREEGFRVAVYTARNMRTFAGSIGRINAVTLPIIIDWLQKHDVPFDEIYVGKPWCGPEGFYVDDKAIRPDEFASLSRAEIAKLVGSEAPQ